MLKLLSKIKDECQREGIDLINSEINGNAIKLACYANGRRDTELNAYIIPDGDSFNFFTISPAGTKSDEINITEEQILPTLVTKMHGERSTPESSTEIDEDLVDVLTIEVADDTYDTKEVRHNSYKNSRYAYSNKYSKMGVIVDIKTRRK